MNYFKIFLLRYNLTFPFFNIVAEDGSNLSRKASNEKTFVFCFGGSIKVLLFFVFTTDTTSVQGIFLILSYFVVRNDGKHE